MIRLHSSGFDWKPDYAEAAELRDLEGQYYLCGKFAIYVWRSGSMGPAAQRFR